MEPCEERHASHINELIKRPNTLSQLDYEVKLCSSEVSIDMYFHIHFLHRHYISHFNAFLAADSTTTVTNKKNPRHFFCSKKSKKAFIHILAISVNIKNVYYMF